MAGSSQTEPNQDQTAAPLGVSAMSDEFVKCPHAYYQSALSTAPVFQDQETGMYWIMRHDLIKQVAKDTETFSSRIDVIADVYKDGMDPEVAEIRGGGVTRIATLLTQDPPEHRTYRDLVNMTFAMDKVLAMRPYMAEIANSLIDEFPKDGPVEFISAFAAPLPVTIIADQLGVPRERADNIKDWSDAIVDLLGQVGDREHQIDCARRERASSDYLFSEVERCRKDPKQNIISDLCTLTYHPLDGEPRPLNDEELISILTQLMVAGNETSTNTIAGGMWYLAQDPDLLAQLRDGDERTMKVFVEEILRIWSPNQGQFRRTTRDVDVEGVIIPKGAMVHLRYGAGNFDDSVFTDPETIDLSRPKPRQHLTFGTGIHTCVGAPLARQEILTGFQVLLDRFNRFELAEDPADLSVHRHYNLRGLTKLHINCIE